MYHNNLDLDNGKIVAITLFLLLLAQKSSSIETSSIQNAKLDTTANITSATNTTNTNTTNTSTNTTNISTNTTNTSPSSTATCNPSNCVAECLPICDFNNVCILRTMTNCAICPTSQCVSRTALGLPSLATPTPTPTNQPSGSSSKTPLIGGVAGGVGVVLILGIVLVYFYIKRKRQRRNSKPPFRPGTSNTNTSTSRPNIPKMTQTQSVPRQPTIIKRWQSRRENKNTASAAAPAIVNIQNNTLTTNYGSNMRATNSVLPIHNNILPAKYAPSRYAQNINTQLSKNYQNAIGNHIMVADPSSTSTPTTDTTTSSVVYVNKAQELLDGYTPTIDKRSSGDSHQLELVATPQNNESRRSSRRHTQGSSILSTDRYSSGFEDEDDEEDDTSASDLIPLSKKSTATAVKHFHPQIAQLTRQPTQKAELIRKASQRAEMAVRTSAKPMVRSISSSANNTSLSLAGASSSSLTKVGNENGKASKAPSIIQENPSGAHKATMAMARVTTITRPKADRAKLNAATGTYSTTSSLSLGANANSSSSFGLDMEDDFDKIVSSSNNSPSRSTHSPT